MKPGERLNVPTPSGQQATVTIPDRSKWIYVSTGQATFDATIPAATSAPNSVSGSDTSAAPTHSALASGLNKNTNYATPANAEEWVRYDNISGGQYRAPHLGMVPARVPPTPTVIRPSGRRRALLIGINYKGTRAALRGCVNDAENMKRLLMKHGFPNDGSHMVVLTDDSTSKRNYKPTGANIFRAIKWLLQGVAEGDVLFFHFSGHGAQVPDQTGHEADGLNETILPLDFQNKQITDDELWGSLVRPLPAGVRLTALMDCCHSGTGLDLPYEYKISSKTTKNRWGSSSKPSTNSQWIEEINPAHSQGDVVLFSGCEDDQTSADVQTSNSAAGGAMTQSFVAAYNENPMATYPEFMKAIHKSLKRRNFSQRPQLTSSQPFNASERVFSLVDGIEPNRNQEIGRMKTRHVRAGKVKKGHSMGDIMGIGAAMAGGLLLGELLF